MSQGKVWFITGAARGIGVEIVGAALSAGDRVVATSRNPDRIADAFQEHTDRLLTVELDVTQERQAFAAVEASVAHFGRIDVLVNNAGFGQFGIFEQNTAAEIQHQFETNVFGTFHVTRAALPVLRKQRSGHIFNLSSMAGVLGFPAAAVYCSTKFAIEGFSESLALEVAEFGIRVTVVEPGFTRTDFLDARSIRYGTREVAGYGELPARYKANFDSHHGVQIGDPKKLAAALLTLARSERAPLRFASGSDAFDGIANKLASMQNELQSYRPLSTSIDIDAH